jgi:hypothetical protein
VVFLMAIEKLTGELYTDNVDTLIADLNANKNKFYLFVFENRVTYFSFKITHVTDPVDEKKLYDIIVAFLETLTEGYVQREVGGIITDRIEIG